MHNDRQHHALVILISIYFITALHILFSLTTLLHEYLLRFNNKYDFNCKFKSQY